MRDCDLIGLLLLRFNEQITNKLFHFFPFFICLQTEVPDIDRAFVYIKEAKGDWDFRISDLIKNPDETYLTPVVNFGELRWAHLGKYALLISTLGPLGSFQIF